MAEIIQGIADLLWPIIVIILIIILVVFFRPAIAAIIESAKSRKFTIKIGGQELTMEEASKLQREVITDLQTKVLELKGGTKSARTLAEPLQAERFAKSIAILWVDDNPKNNSYFVQQLRDMNFTVDLALSTSDGLRQFNEGQYEVVISDMGRQEARKFNHTAGLDLVKQIRAISPTIPFVMLTRSSNVRKYASETKAAGVTLITSSWTEILGILLKEFAKKK